MEPFYRGIAMTISCAQFFGVMPLWGLRSISPLNLSFSWKSKRILITVGFLMGNFTMAIMYFTYFRKIGLTVKNMVSLVFYTVGTCSYFLFLLLARKWPKIIRFWTEKEEKFLKGPYLMPERTKFISIRIISILICIFGTGENLMYHSSTIYSFHQKMLICNITEEPIQLFYSTEYRSVFSVVPYNHGISFMIQVLSFGSTFMWNFMDLFIILVSIGLTTRFEQIYHRLKVELAAGIRNRISRSTWEELFREIRLDFLTLCDLLGYVDRQLSFIILLACFNNLYYICYQLMNIFNVLRYFVNYAYFWYSLLYLVGRTAFLFITAASICDASRKPVSLLRSVPRYAWCGEAERFLYHLNMETIALSAMQCFHFTRTLLLTMVGTVMTFEIIIVQYSRESSDYDLKPLCDNI